MTAKMLLTSWFSIEKHIEALKPLVPKQAIVCIGEYPIKTLLREPIVSRDGTLPIFIENQAMTSTSGYLKDIIRIWYWGLKMQTLILTSGTMYFQQFRKIIQFWRV